MVDYQRILEVYILHISECEGTDFLGGGEDETSLYGELFKEEEEALLIIRDRLRRE